MTKRKRHGSTSVNTILSKQARISSKSQEDCYQVLRDEEAKEVKELCIKNVPFWNTLTHEDIEVEIVTTAVSNRVFRVTIVGPKKNLYPLNKLIVKKRISTNSLLFDTEFQYEVSKLLGDNNCGPKVLGRFGDYTIQEWIYGNPTTIDSLRNISAVTSLATSLAKFHKKATELAPKEWDRTPLIHRRLTEWSKHIVRIIKKYNLDLESSELLGMVETYKTVLENYNKSSRSIANSVMFCHNDLYNSNMIDIQHGLYLVDFEYSGFNYIGLEFSSFFKKIYIVHDEAKNPYFKTDNTPYISEDMKPLFVAVYLSQLLDKNVLPSDLMVKEFLDSVEVHSLGTDLYFLFWHIMMMDRPARESIIIPGSYAECKLHCIQFKEQLRKLRDKNMIQY